MRYSILLGLMLITTTGCVTESVYLGSDKPVVENKIDNAKAARTRISLALKYLTSGDSAQAKYNLELAANFSPDSPEVHYTMAYYYQQVGENDAAKKSYLYAISLDPDDPNTLNNYGVFLCGLGEYDRASEYILRAIAVPSYLLVANSYENLALCAIENNEFVDAEQYLEASLRHGPSRGSSLINLSALYYAKSDLHRAQKLMQRYERSGLISSRSLMLFYLIENRMGHIEKAGGLSVMLQETYGSSIEARQIKQNKISNSEFERLRERFRKNELGKLRSEFETDVSTITKKPTVKILKRKSQKQQRTAETVVQSTSEVVTKPTGSTATHQQQTVQTEVTETPRHSTVKPNNLQLKNKPYHLVKQGESLFAISVKYNVKLAKLLQWNNLAEDTPVYPGAKIYLESPNAYHLVEDGDTLYAISVKYNVLLEKIAQWNNVNDSTVLNPGDKIFIEDPKIYAL
jgi:type IV pilus assembly protein PilF